METAISAFTSSFLSSVNILWVIAGLFGLLLISGMVVVALNWLERRVERAELEKKILRKDNN
ncbi:MAG: hypothetical protein Q4A96_00995 [Candidatus Saccharibacteria bacterium]|nr:hypothetical protein [Candidatus Saccharibacteria bacterium]